MISRQDIRKWALELAYSSKDTDPSVLKTFWFPNNEQIRVVHVIENSLPNDQVLPFYFLPGQFNDFPVPIAVAAIRPEEVRQLKLPDGWGTWDEAEEILVANDSVET